MYGLCVFEVRVCVHLYMVYVCVWYKCMYICIWVVCVWGEGGDFGGSHTQTVLWRPSGTSSLFFKVDLRN